MRSLKQKGLRLEKGKILDRDYTGPVLEKVLKTNKIVHEVPIAGTYKGKNVVVAPIRSKEGKIIGALGIVDLLATIDIPSVFQEYIHVLEEVKMQEVELIKVSISYPFNKLQTENIFIASKLKVAIYTESKGYLFALMSESVGRIIYLKPSCSKASLASFFFGPSKITMYSTFFDKTRTPVN